MTHSPTLPRILSTQLIGAFSRFRLVELQTRFGGVEWLLEDAETPDPETGLPSVVAQGTEEHCRGRAGQG